MSLEISFFVPIISLIGSKLNTQKSIIWYLLIDLLFVNNNLHFINAVSSLESSLFNFLNFISTHVENL